MKTRFYILLSMTLLLLTHTSCVYDNDIPCGSEDPDLLVINLNLTVPSSSTGTRSAGHEPVAGNDDENYINIDGDYQVLLFDKDGALVEGKLSEFKCEENGVSDGMTSYTLTTQLSLSGNEAKEKLSEFKIMVLANWKSFERSNTRPGYTYPSFKDYRVSDDPEDPDNIYKDGDNFNFTLNKPNDNLSWVPSISENKAIPMFGISGPIRLKDAQDMGKYSDNPVANIFMLRALAKIEIVDMVPDEAGASMERCVLTRSNKYGRFIPDVTVDGNTGWDTPNIQISAPSLPALYAGAPAPDDAFMTGVQFIKSTEPTLVKFDDGTEKTMDKDHHVIYVPEMDLSDLSVSNAGRPVIEIYTKGVSAPNIIELSEYLGGKPKPRTEGSNEYAFYGALLRNHIYRYNIKSVGSAVLDFVVETPWGATQGQEWDFEDIKISFMKDESRDGTFSWDSGTTDFEEREDDILHPQRTLLITLDDWVEGSFWLQDPAKGSWAISLYSDDNSPNSHFRIDRWGDVRDEQTGEMVQGWIEGTDVLTGKVGEDVRFRIIPTATNSSSDHYTARVVMTCTTFDGQLTEVNLPYVVENVGKGGAGMDGMLTPTVESNGYYFVKQYFSGLGDIPAEESN